jgi:hypothetical protein
LKLLSKRLEFVCEGETYLYDIKIFVDTNSNTINFRFSSDNNFLPPHLQEFHLITTFHKHIIFNRLPEPQTVIERELDDCIKDFILHFNHPDVPGVYREVD